MPVTRDQPAPYAPPSSILALIERHRNKGLPSPVDADVLGRAGISESLINRTLQALQVLDLVAENGSPSEVLEGLRLAPEGEYKQRLTEWLNNAYADALGFVDPATDDEVAIRDAFRSYKPVGQQARMVTLFMGLYAAAGVMPEKQMVVRKPPQAGIRKPPTPTAPKARANPNGGSGGAGEQKHDSVKIGGVPPALAGLLASLPSQGAGWPKDQRDKFYATFGAVLDFCFPIMEARTPKENDD
ncbi:MAG: DUF5343 domain-containing protein [Sphingosinicella sp.]|nr:DUF5343 domain-containing protein [Sphingosinicella sp.]